jgi:hypothetical protein
MEIKLNSSLPIPICAAAMVVAFFMPWAHFGPMGISGYSISQLADQGVIAWIVPILALITVGLSFSSVPNRGMAVVAGVVALIVIAYFTYELTGALVNMGGFSERRVELGDIVKAIGKGWSFGAWLTVAAGIAIIVAAFRPQATTGGARKPSRYDGDAFAQGAAKIAERGATYFRTVDTNVRNETMRNLFFFDAMLTPRIITFVYWLALLVVVIAGIGTMFGSFFTGLLILVGGAVCARIWCELLIVLFKINDHARTIATRTAPLKAPPAPEADLAESARETEPRAVQPTRVP